jgi:hypothetical protein
MEDTQVEEISQVQAPETPADRLTPISRFDDAEYERWSEKIRSASSKGK